VIRSNQGDVTRLVMNFKPMDRTPQHQCRPNATVAGRTMKMSFMAESSLSLNLHFFVDSIGGHCLAQDGDALET
jgi:hypothetical protein